MCSNLLDCGGVTVACRKCNECISARLQTWVARAMAEKAVSPYCYAVTLTYADDTQARRDGAEAFRYSDVRLFLAGIRADIKRRTGAVGALRFICAGERGSDRGRVHWHIVLFADFDLLDLGEWHMRGRPFTGDKLSSRNRKVRLNWSLWPHGFSQFEEPDDNGMAYCLKYALKDQFSVKRSAGTARIAKAENYASSYFRMSKAPAIGHAWLWGHLQGLVARGWLPVSLNIKVPNYWGFWWLAGQVRLDVLRYLRLECDHMERTPSQLSAFVASLSENDLAVWHGEEVEDEEDEGYEAVAASRKRALIARENAQRVERRATRRKCGGFTPCAACLDAIGAVEKQDAARYAEAALHEAYASGCSGSDIAGQWADRQAVPNPFCQRGSERAISDAFKDRIGG